MSDPGKAVFLSYASQDAEAAKRICEALRATGVEVWFDQSELVGGDQWDAKIRGQIGSCGLFVPIISANTQARREGYFRIEWKLAAQRTHAMADGTPFLLPLLIDGTRDAEALVPAEFKSVQWTKLPLRPIRPAHDGQTQDFQPGDAAMAAFCARVQRLLDGDVGRDRPIPPQGATAGYGDPALQKNRPRWLAPVLAGAVIAALALVFARPWERPASAPVTAAPPALDQTKGISESRKLTAQALTLIDDDLMAGRENFRLAQELAQKATVLDPTDGEAWAVLARVLVETWGRNYDSTLQLREQARSAVDRATRLAPVSVESGLAACGYQGLSGQMVEAERIARETLARFPNDQRCLRQLAEVCFETKKVSEAMDLLHRSGTLNGGDVRALTDEASYYRGQMRLVEAEAIVDRAMALAPSFSGFQLKLLLLMQQDELDRAQPLVEQIPARLQQEDVFASLIANYWTNRGEPDRALEILQRVPRDFFEEQRQYLPKGWPSGWAMQMSGRPAAAKLEWEQALAVVEKRLKTEPKRRDLILYRSRLLALLGQRAEADAAVQLALELNNKDKVGAAISLANVRVCAGDNEGAIKYILEAMSDPAELFGHGLWHNLKRHPMYAPIRSDPRIQQLIAWGDERMRQLKAGSASRPTSADNGPPVISDKSVAVLAFANLSDDKANEYFSDGISEELLNVLGRVPGLRVAAPLSAFSFKGKNISAQEIGQKLNVAYLVNGSVRRADTEVRVVARLSRADTGEQIWTDKFTGEAKNVFALQDEIAGKIAAALSLKLGASARAAKPINPEAYRLYLEGRHFWSLRSFGGFDRAEVALKRAVALEPESALMRAGLAELYATRGWYRDQNAEDSGDNYSLASAEAARAVALDPENAQATVAQATIAIARRQFAEAARLLQRALTLAPNDAAAFDRLGDLMVRTGRLDAAVENYQRAMQLDPLSVYLVRDVVRELGYARRFRDVIETVDRFEATSPRDWRTIVWRAQALVNFGKADQAAAELKAVLPSITSDEFSSSGASIAELVFSLRAAKCEAESDAMAKRLLDRHRPGTYLHAMVLTARGRMEEALPLMVAFPTGTEDRLYWSAVFDPVRDDPRFLRKIEELGVAAEYKVARETLARMVKELEAKK